MSLSSTNKDGAQYATVISESQEEKEYNSLNTEITEDVSDSMDTTVVSEDRCGIVVVVVAVSVVLTTE